jgi:thioesterase domain-containing protein/acyl carrier protein
MLRTVFAEEDGQPVQVVMPSLTIPLPVIDLRYLSDELRVIHGEELSVEEARKRFSISAVPLIRMTLLRMDESEHILLLTVHQMVSDCWSSGMISHELGTLYGAFSRGEESPLPDLPIQYGDYAIWQQEWLANHGLDAQLGYWSRQLAGLPPLEVPTDRPRPSKKTSNGEILSAVLPKELTEALKDLSHREGCTFFMLSLAALKVLLHRIVGQDDLYVGTITAGRSRVEMEPLIGRFINPLVIRTNLSSDPTFLEFLAAVRERVIEALENRDIPYESVVEAIRPRDDPSRHPVFQINFVHQRAFVRPLELASVSLSGIPSKSAGAIYDLYFFLVERGEGWRLSCEYNIDLYEEVTVERMLVQFRAILHAIAADPALRISALQDASGSLRPSTLRWNGDSNGTLPAQGMALSRRPGRSFIDPKDEFEEQVARVWRLVLGLEQISTTADFFDEGGHSVLAARLIARMQDEFGVRLSLGQLLRTPTIQGLAARLRGCGPAAESDRISPIQPQGSRRPLFLVFGGPFFRPLARALGEEQPVFGLHLPFASDNPERLSVGEMATRLIDAMREVQPNGPYTIGGWCRSGIIAFEIARKLRELGEEVALLILFDTSTPAFSRRLRKIRSTPSGLYRSVAPKLASAVRTLGPSTLRDLAGSVRFKAQKIGGGWRRTLRRSWYGRTDAPLGNLRQRQEMLHDIAIDAYEPAPSDAPIVVILSSAFDSCPIDDRSLGWSAHAKGRFETIDVPFGHEVMFHEPMVATVASKINECLGA